MKVKIDTQLLNRHIMMCGLSKRQLAKKTGIHPATITNITRGHRVPTLYVMRLFFDSLNLTDEEFIKIFFPDRFVLRLDKEDF